MKARIILAAMAFAVLLAVWSTQAQQPSSSSSAPMDISKIKDDLRLREQILARQFAEFENALLKLKDRLKRSGKTEDKQRAEILEKVLEQSKDASISVQFEQMVEMLKNSKLSGIGDLKILDERSHKLADDLREILAKMREDPKQARLRDERLSLEKLIKEIEKVIHDEKVVQAQTDRNKTDPKELENNQKRVTKATGDIAKEIAKKNTQGGEAKNTKGDAKGGGKEGKKGESKDAGKAPETKKGESKEAGPESKASKGDAKGEPKAKEGKPGEAQAKKGDQGKDGAKQSKGTEGAKSDPKENKTAKGGDPKEAKAKDGGGKASAKEGDKKGEAKAAKNPEAKQGEAKAGPKESTKKDGGEKTAKNAEAKPGDAKSGGKKADADAKQAEAKPGQKNADQGQAKSGPQGDQPEQKDNPPPQAQQPKDNIANGKKQVEDAEYKMKQAEENIAKKKNREASDDQGKAIDNLEKAKKKLEDLLRQIREEELERLLAALQARCEKMLALQVQVQNGTEGIYKVVEGLADKKPNRQNQQDSLKLSDNEKDIVLEATKAIELLEAEGSAVAFPEVFQQVRQDMMHVQRRLEVTDIGLVTQAIEKDIIDTLKEMIDALKKARQELDQKKSPPPPPSSGQPPQQDQKLLDQIAELKMIRSMQLRVNTRTETYGKMYVAKEGEQTADPAIRRELSNLSERQERIFDITNRIAKGDNK